MIGTDLAPGLLIAVPQLDDPNFARSVVLMIEHNDRGSFGLVINQPSEVTASELLDSLAMRWAGDAQTVVWSGGPVARSTGWVLHEPVPALVGEGMAAVSAGTTASEADVAHAMELMTALGKAITVPEAYQDAVTAISGSGPAYLFFVVEAMIDAGVLLGLPRDISSTLVQQTVFGSAKLLVESGQHPTVLREQVTSPGGTTAAALRQLEDHKVKAAFLTAMEAARDRSRALAG